MLGDGPQQMGQLKNQVKKRPAALFAPTDREENDVKPATLALADKDDSESNKGNKKQRRHTC